MNLATKLSNRHDLEVTKVEDRIAGLTQYEPRRAGEDEDEPLKRVVIHAPNAARDLAQAQARLAELTEERNDAWWKEQSE